MSRRELWRLNATQLVDSYQRREVSPVEVTESVLERLTELNGKLNAFLSTDVEGARNSARVAEAVWQRRPQKAGPLCGVPVSVKDSIEMAGLPTTYGSLTFTDNMRPDSAAVARLRAAGAVIVGKTNTPEFTLLPHVQNRITGAGVNPWNHDRTCGGSSGGSASSVASGTSAVSLGSDAGGSIRIPASYCGVVGFKPSYQQIPNVQAWRAAPLRGHLGPIGRTVADVKRMFQAIRGAHESDSWSQRLESTAETPHDAPIVIGVLSDSYTKDIDTKSVPLNELCDALSDAGIAVVDAPVPISISLDQLPAARDFAIEYLRAVESIDPHALESRRTQFTDYALDVMDQGARMTAGSYYDTLAECERIRNIVWKWQQDFDFILTPAVGQPPALDTLASLTGGQETRASLSFPLLRLANIALAPSIVLPIGQDVDGFHRSIQLVGRYGSDQQTLGMAEAVEQMAARYFGADHTQFPEDVTQDLE